MLLTIVLPAATLREEKTMARCSVKFMYRYLMVLDNVFVLRVFEAALPDKVLDKCAVIQNDKATGE